MLCAIAREPFFEEYYSSLAIAGVDGSLRRRMIGTAAHNNVRGKTGTLRNVSSLGGYVTTRDGELLAFTILSNGPKTGSYKAAENTAAALLAGFAFTPSTDATIDRGSEFDSEVDSEIGDDESMTEEQED